MREKLEKLAKVSGWNNSLSRGNGEDYSADEERSEQLIEHVMQVLFRKEETCSELSRALNRQQLEMEASKEQIQVANERIREMRGRLAEGETSALELKSRIGSLTGQLNVLEGNLKREHAQATWSKEELQKALGSFAAFRREQATEVAALRSQLQTADIEAQSARAQLQRITHSAQGHENQLLNLQDHLAAFKTEVKSKEEENSREVTSLRRMIQLYQKAGEDAEGRIRLLQEELDELRDALITAEAEESERFAALQNDFDEQAALIREKDVQLEKLRAVLDEILSSKPSSKDIDGVSADFKDFATLLEADQSALQQFFSEFSICRGKLIRTEEECGRLKHAFQEVLQEVSLRTPLFEGMKNENSRLQGDVAALTEQLIQAASVRDSVISEKSTLERSLSILKTQNAALIQECADLSYQVQSLLGEIEMNSSSTMTTAKRPRNVPASADSEVGVLKASDVISENLVDLTSIAQLQQRNQDLLRALRGVTARYEALEREGESPELKNQLQHALKELDEMHEARRRQTQLVETIIRGNRKEPKDLEEAGSSDAEALNPAGPLKLHLQQEELLQRQLKEKQETLSQTLKELEVVGKDLSAERVQCTRLTAQMEANAERLKLLQDALDLERAETGGLRDRLAGQSDAVCLAQTTTHKLLAELSVTKEEANQLRNQIDHLQGEQLNSLVIEVARLQQEASTANQERDRLVQVLNGLQGSMSDHETSETALKQHFSVQLAFFERELQAARIRESDHYALHSSALTAVERDRSELLKRLEALTGELGERKEEVSRLQGLKEASEEKVIELERILQQTAQITQLDDSNQKANELKVKALSIELKSVQGTLKGARQSLEEVSSQLTIKEEEMICLQNQLQAEQAGHEASREVLKQTQEQFSQLQSDLDARNGQLEQLEKELSDLKTLSVELQQAKEECQGKSVQISGLEDERSQLSLQFNGARAQIVQLESSVDSLRSENASLSQNIGELQGRLQGLQDQNNQLLDEIQRAAAPSEPLGTLEMFSSPDSQSPSSSVIQFLREEKDRLGEERDRLQGEARRYQNQAEDLERVLKEERAAVSAQSADYSRLLGQLERFNELRENHARTQGELDQIRVKATKLEETLRQQQSRATPLQAAFDQLEGEAHQLRQELTAVQADRDSWKERFDSVVISASQGGATLDSLQSELKQSKLQNEMFKQRALALTKALADAKLTAQQELEALRGEIARLKKAIEDQQAVVSEPEELGSGESEADHMEIDALVHGSEAAKASEMDVLELDEKSADIENGKSADIENEKVAIIENEKVAIADGRDAEFHESEDEDDGSEGLDYEDEVVEGPEVTEATEATEENDLGPLELAAPQMAPLAADSNPASAADAVTSPLLPAVAPLRKKIVSLAGIVNSSQSSSTSPTIVSPVNVITTASGKKIIPITFPEPTTTSTNSEPSEKSPNTKKKLKKGNAKLMMIGGMNKKRHNNNGQ